MPNDSETLTTATHDDGQPAKRKRLRIPKSCIPCLKGKRACDRGRPACGRCARSGQGIECSYDPRLPKQPGSRSAKRSGAYDDSDDDDDASPHDSSQLAALQAQLEDARNETRRLQQLLRAQVPAPAPASPHASTSVDRYTAPSHANDLHAARGLQMLAEIAGPQHQDAISNASQSRILHWSGPTPHASSSSHPSSGHPTPSSGYDSARHHGAHATDLSGPSDRYSHTPGASSVYHAHFQRRTLKSAEASRHDDLDSPKNINGTQMYYGNTSSGDGVLRKVAARSAHASRSDAANVATSIHETMARRDMQSAFNSVLDPSRDTFPFATIWSSGTAFIQEVLPFFPRAEDFDSICASFVRHFSAMCPALTIPTAIDYAKTFSRMSRKQQAQISLPWLAVFLMICALGKNCDLESTTVGVDRKVRMLDAFLAGEASQQPSRQPSRASSPEPSSSSNNAAADAPQPASSSASRPPAMVSDLFLSAAYQSLRLCSFLSSPTLQTIHSQLLIGAYLLNTERAASFWPLLGSVARQAQSIGLHVDPYKIKRDWDPVEADTRRRLWWAVVHQDVILSGIFGRPLGITRFSCRFPGTNDAALTGTGATTYATLQCEFSQFARIYLDENQDRSWSQAKVIDFTEQVLQWYMGIPERYRPDLGRIDLLGSDDDLEATHNYRAAGVDLKTKGLMEVHQSGNLAVEVFYILLSLHRSNLFPPAASDTDAETSKNGASGKGGELNHVSLHICTQALRRITRAQQTMVDLLGRARATMFWKIAYYTYQAAIAGAHIVFLLPQSKHAESALEDLAILTDFFDRMPDKWTGLRMAKHGLRVLRKLAVAARETPEAASMAVRAPGVGGDAAVGGSPTVAGGLGFENGSGNAAEGAGTADSAPMTPPAPPSLHQHPPLSGGGEAFPPSMAFLPALYGSSFMSPVANSQPVMGNDPMLQPSSSLPSTAPPFHISSGSSGAGGGCTEPTSLFAGALAASAGSPLTRSLANVPLVTLFNNTYDQQESIATPKQSFCYDPFIPDPTTTFATASSTNPRSTNGGPGSASPSASERRTSSISPPSTTFSTHTSAVTTETNGGKERANHDHAQAEYAGESATHDLSPTPLNQKDLANYWSEYFSLQLDWDRLTGLA